jgi:glycosyltransferase involved in cell wall biosynthesis
MPRKRVCIVVDNDIYKDVRVRKFRKTLAEKYHVLVVGFSKEVVSTARISDNFILTGSVLLYSYEKIKSLYKRLRPSSEMMTAVQKNSGRTSPKFLLRDLLWYWTGSLIRSRLHSAISGLKVDVFHANDLPILPAVTKAAKKTNSKVIYDSHELYMEQGMFLSDLITNRYTNYERKGIHQSNAVITVNEFIAKELKKRYKINKEPYVIYNYPHATATKMPEKKTDDETTLLYQGLYAPGRGLEELIESMKYVDNQFRLKLRGVGDYRFRLRDLVKKHKLEDKVEILPPVKSSELTKSAQFADVGVIMYEPDCLNSYFASPNKLFEYVNAGLAILCNDLPFVKSIVTKYGLGVCSPQINPKTLAATINQFNRENIRIFKNNARKVSNTFTWENQESIIYEIYDNVLSGS